MDKDRFRDWDNFPLMSLMKLQTEKLEELHLNIWSDDYFNKAEIKWYKKILKKILKESPRLHTFKMKGMEFVPDYLEMIVDKDAFKSLIFDNFPLSYKAGDTTKVIRYLKEFKNLEHCEFYTLVELTDGLLKILIDNCKKLITFLLDTNDVTDAGLLLLKSLPNLEVLRIRDCQHISDINLHHFSKLKSLELRSTPSIKDEGLIRLLQSSQTLRKLELTNTEITIDCMKAANEAVKKRTNGLSLEIVLGISYPLFSLENQSPLLIIV